MKNNKVFAVLIVLCFLLFPFGDSFAYSAEGSMINLVPSATAGWSFEGNQEFAWLGYSWRPAGDVNDDGFDDIVIGAFVYDTPAIDAGRVIAFYGSEVGYATTPNWTVNGENTLDYYGISVNGAGDVNGDGFDDVLVGAHGYDGGLTNIGKAYLYYGSEDGLLLTPAWTLTGTQTDEYIGRNLAGIGDIDGDGYDDIAVGAHGLDAGETDEGRLNVFYGSADGLNSTPDWTAESNQTNAQFGLFVNGIGDINDDGYDDLLVAAPFYDLNTIDEGAVFAWYGDEYGLGDPGTPANADWMAESNQASVSFGISLGTPGDVNGDGYDDVVVGTQAYDYNSVFDSGVTFLWYGSEQGVNEGVAGNPTNVDWLASSNSSGYAFGSMTGTKANINNDDYDDVVIGCLLGMPGIYVYFGSESGPNLGVNGTLTNADWQVTVSNTPEFFNSIFGWLPASPGDANGDGVEDVVVVARDYQAQIGPGNPGYREGKIWAYYSNAGVISGTVTCGGCLGKVYPIRVTAHVSLTEPPITYANLIASGETYIINGLPAGSYYISAYLDLNDSGGPPDPGEPNVMYDSDGDGVADQVVVAEGARITGIDMQLIDCYLYLPLIIR